MIVLLYTQAMALWIIPRRFFLFLSMQSNGALNEKFKAPFSLPNRVENEPSKNGYHNNKEEQKNGKDT